MSVTPTSSKTKSIERLALVDDMRARYRSRKHYEVARNGLKLHGEECERSETVPFGWDWPPNAFEPSATPKGAHHLRLRVKTEEEPSLRLA